MIRLFTRLSYLQLRRHPVQAMLMIAGVALGVATWCMSVAIERSLDLAMQSASGPSDVEADIYVSNGDAGVPRACADYIKRIPGVQSVRCRVIERVTLPDLGNHSAILVGIEQAEENSLTIPGVQVTRSASSDWVWSRTSGRQDALVGHELSEDLGKLRHAFRVLVNGQREMMSGQGVIEATGAAAGLAGRVIVVTLEDALRITGRRGAVTRLDIVVDPSTAKTEVLQSIQRASGGLLRVCLAEDQVRPTGDVLQTVKDGLSLGGMGAIPLGVFLVASMTAVTVAERQRETGILRAIGATRRQLRGMFLGEAIVIGFCASTLGIGLGQLLAFIAVGPIQKALSDTVVPVELQHIQLSLLDGCLAALLGAGAMVLGSIVPVWRGTNADPLESIRRRPPSRLRPHPWMGFVVVAIALASAGALLAWQREILPGRWGGYVGLTLIILGALIACPYLGTLFHRATQRLVPWLSWRLAIDSILGAPGRSAFVMIAVALSVAFVVQLAGVIRSNDLGVRRWVDRSIAGDLFVTAGGPLTASGQSRAMAESLGDELASTVPGSQFVPMRFRFIELTDQGGADRVLVLALDATKYVLANKHRPTPLPDVESFRELSKPGTMIVSENYAALHGLKLGDVQVVPGARGFVDLRVVGVVPDYSCARGTIMVDRHAHGQDFSDDGVDVLDFYLPADVSPEKVRRQWLADPLSTRHELSILTRDDLRSHILGMVHRLYGLAYAQEVVLGGVAGIGIAASLVVSTLLRRRELGMLRAQGATRGQLMRTVLAEATLLSTFGALFGLLLGILLDSYTLDVILADETGFPLPFDLPVTETCLAVAMSVLAAVAAGWGPARHASRQSIASAIGCE